MVAGTLTESFATDLARAVEQEVAEKTWRRLRELRAELVDGRLVVHGLTSSYYFKQLALKAVQDVLGPGCSLPVTFDIQVDRVGSHV